MTASRSTADTLSADIVVIGAGIAGAGVAACLADRGARVLLLERESQPGYHTTGRSAALFSETYGPPTIQALSRASRVFFDDPGEGFADHPLLSERGVLFVARDDQADALDRLLAAGGPDHLTRLTAAEARTLLPALRPDYIAAAAYELAARDIDVAGLHQGYLKRLTRGGGAVRTDAGVAAIARDGEGWRITLTDGGVLTTSTLVNAAGAWADAIGEMAGCRPLGLVPKRRTALLVDPPPGMDSARWPMLVDAEEAFYAKPDAGKLLLSPADATPSPAVDAQPEELDVAIAVDRVTRALDLTVRRIEHRWAGLRTFAPDGDPVAGPDPAQDGFFWLAGQGGYGIQTAPALSRFAAASILGEDIPADIAAAGVTEAALAPARFEPASIPARPVAS